MRNERHPPGEKRDREKFWAPPPPFNDDGEMKKMEDARDGSSHYFIIIPQYGTDPGEVIDVPGIYFNQFVNKWKNKDFLKII